MPETDTAELEFIQRKADALNLYVNRHKQYDPLLPGGDLYLMRKKKFGSEHEPSILRYATADQIWSFLNQQGGCHAQGARRYTR